MKTDEGPDPEDVGGDVLVSDDRQIRTVTIQQERRRNALTEAMIETMCEAVADFATSPELKVLVLTGSGDQAFCAGADLKEMAEKQASGAVFSPVMPRLFDALLGLTKPTIAAINGDAVGGGFEIALCCSVRVAKAGIRVGLPEITLGMVPRYGTAQAALLSSPAVAIELALFGELMLAEAALASHLVDRVVSAEDFSNSVRGLAEQLERFSTLAVAGVLHVARRASSIPIRDLVNSPQATATFGTPQREQAVREFNRGALTSRKSGNQSTGGATRSFGTRTAQLDEVRGLRLYSPVTVRSRPEGTA